MIPYLFFILVSLVLFFISTATYKKTPIFFVSYLIFVLPLSFLGGFRDETVGTDVHVYGVLYFQNALRTQSIFDLITSVKGEWGYHILIWICSRISNDIHFFFFVSELIKILLVSSTALYFRKIISPTLFMFAYLTFFYFTGFNIMRQVFAVSIIIYGLRYLFEKEQWKFLFICFLATMFHSSAIVALLIFPIYILAHRKYLSIFVHASILVALFIGISIVLERLKSLNLGIYSEKALLYTQKEGAIIAKTNILIAFSFLLSSWLFKFRNIKIPSFNNLYFIFCILIAYNLVFLIISPMFEVAFRLSWYQIPLMLIIYLIYLKNQRSHQNRILLETLFIIVFILHFTIEALHGLGDTIPYTSKILGI